MRIDYHLHTSLCKHAVGTIDEYVERARECGLDEIGFADHNPLPNEFDREHRMEMEQFETYVQMVANVQDSCSALSIKMGLEVDYLPGGEDFLQRQLECYPFDYIYGSVHYLGDWNFDNPELMHIWDTHAVDHVYQRYFDTLLKMIDTGLFDIVTHPDLVKKFGHRPESLDLAPLYHETAQRIRRQNMCLEVNTAGLRKEVGEIYPEKQFLEIARQHEVPIVIGSDAHCPGEVGADYVKAMALVRSVGYTHVQQFSGRTAVPVPL